MNKIGLFLGPKAHPIKRRPATDKKTIILQFYNKHNELSFQSISSIPSSCPFFLSTHNLTMILINPVNKDFYGQFSSMMQLIYLFGHLSYNPSFKALFNTELIELLNCLRSKAGFFSLLFFNNSYLTQMSTRKW